MKKGIFAIVGVVTLLLSILAVLPVMSGLGDINATNGSKTTDNIIGMTYENTEDLSSQWAGQWEGTTSQGKAVSFEVRGKMVYYFVISHNSPIAGAVATARYYEGFNIVGNAFQYELRSFGKQDMIYGEFTSPSVATGTYRSTQTAQHAGGTSWDSGNITWSARKVSGLPKPSPKPSPTPTPTHTPTPPSIIQSKIDAANPGDTIIIKDGVYKCNIKVNKRLTIRSENGPANCIVQAADSRDPVFEVTADYVNISGFTVSGVTELGNAGIYLNNSDYCNIANNNCSNNSYGISLWNSYNNKLTGNIMVDNGISIWGGSLRNYTHEIDESNRVNGKPIYYWKDVEGGRIPDGAGQVILVNCTNITIEKQNLNNASTGVQIAYSSYNAIKNNNCSNNNDYGISLVYSKNNIIANNTCSNNRFGIFLAISDSNSIVNNNCSNNEECVLLLLSSNCFIYLNNFFGNVYSLVSTNSWNSKEKITYTYNETTYTNYLGNYWDGYNGTDTDKDGIGDAPYSINEDRDNYPLMEPFNCYHYTSVHGLKGMEQDLWWYGDRIYILRPVDNR